MNSTDTSAGKESCNSMPSHWHVDGDGVALLNSHTLEDVGNAADFAEELSIGDFATFTWLIALVDDCGLFKEKRKRGSAINCHGGMGRDKGEKSLGGSMSACYLHGRRALIDRRSPR